MWDSGSGGFPGPELTSTLLEVGLERKEPAFCRQVHSNRIFLARTSGLMGEGDGLVSDRPDLALCIQTADCVPIFIYDPDNEMIGLVHAGWRGTSRRIAVGALERMKAVCGTNPGSVQAFMGPSIRSCCYEVGREVAGKFDGRVVSRNAGGPARPPAHQIAGELGAGGGEFLDLPGANQLQMEKWGVKPANIRQDGRCTSCHPAAFSSYRREGNEAGRMICVMALREKH